MWERSLRTAGDEENRLDENCPILTLLLRAVPANNGSNRQRRRGYCQYITQSLMVRKLHCCFTCFCLVLKHCESFTVRKKQKGDNDQQI